MSVEDIEPGRATLWLVVAIGILGMAWGLGTPPLMEPDEGRTALIGLQMADEGNWLVPTINGLPYLDKPFAVFALVAASIKLFGATEFAVRLPSLLSSLLTLAIVVWFGRRRGLVGSPLALAALAFVTSPMVIGMARTTIYDPVLALCTTAALVCFFEAFEAAGERVGPRWVVAAWVSIGLGVQVKGPVALILPLLVAFAFALTQRRFRFLMSWRAVGLFFGMQVPWLLVVERTHPGFLHYGLIVETLGRFASDDLDRSGPVWFFVPYLLASTFPWFFVFGGALLQLLREMRGFSASPTGRLFLFLLLWLVVPFVFFSLSQSKRAQYILPLLPAVSLIWAVVWSSVQNQSKRKLGVVPGAIGWYLMGAVFVATGCGVFEFDTGLTPNVLATAEASVFALGMVMLVSATFALVFRRRSHFALAVLSLPLVSFVPTMMPAMESIGGFRAAKDLAGQVRGAGPVNLVGIETFSTTLDFYLGRASIVASSTGAPYRSNYVLQEFDRLATTQGNLRPHSAWLVALKECDEPTLFLLNPEFISERSTLERAGLKVYAQDRKRVVYGPCGLHGSSVAEVLK